MGEVHLAAARGAAGFEKMVALKVLRADLAGSARRVEALWREALIGARLDHEHLVQVLDLDEADGAYYIVMEYVRGFSLAHVLEHLAAEGERLPLGFAVHLTRATLRALRYMHRLTLAEGRPLSHGDVSASNVLCASDGRIKVSDLGVAALAAEEEPGRVAGKPEYLPREAFYGGRRQQSWDVYAAAAILYRCVTGRAAFEGEGLHRILAAKDAPAAPVTGLRPDCPPELARVVERALAVEPAERFQSADEFLAALDDAYARRLDDGEAWAQFISALYRRERFVAAVGELPAEGHTGSSTFTPAVEQTEALTVDDVKGRRPLRLGLSPALGASVAREVGTSLARLLGRKLGREVRPVVLGDYGSLVDCITGGDVDLAWMPPAAYAVAAERGVGVLAVARRLGGTIFESGLVVRAEAPYQRIADLRGQAAAWVDEHSGSGYVFARALVAGEVGDPASFFGSERFVGSHQAGLEAVLEGWSAVTATYARRDPSGAVVDAGWLDLVPARAAELRPIAFAGPIPGDNIAHRADLPGKLADELRAVLTGLGGDDSERTLLRQVFNAEGFDPSGADEYDGVRAAIAQRAP